MYVLQPVLIVLPQSLDKYFNVAGHTQVRNNF
jgi:hypothetical protein